VQLRKAYTVGVVVLAAMVAGWLTYRSVFHRGTTALNHEAFVTPNTAARIVCCPERVQSYVSRLAPEVLRVIPAMPRLSSVAPRSQRLDWVHYLPVEFTFLVHQNTVGLLDVLLFAKENPDGPNFAGVLNDSDFFKAAYPVIWQPPRAVRGAAGAMTAEGFVRIADHVASGAMAHWPDYHPVSAVAATGAHLLEISADNRNGVLYELHGAISGSHMSAGMTALDPLIEVWPGVASLRFTADLASDDAIRMSLVLDCRDTSTTADIDRLAGLLAMAGDALARALRSEIGLEFVYTIEAGPARITAKMALSGFEPLLRKALARGI